MKYLSIFMHMHLVVCVVPVDGVIAGGLEEGLKVLTVIEDVAPLHLHPALPEGFHSLSAAAQGLKK